MFSVLKKRPLGLEKINGKAYIIHHVVRGHVLDIWPMTHGEALAFRKTMMIPQAWILVEVANNET